MAAYPSMLGTTAMLTGGYPHPGGVELAGVNPLGPKVYYLGQSYPNPSKGALRIAYALPRESQVRLNVYNVSGQLVRSLKNETQKPGSYQVTWDGKDQNGRMVASGVYLYRMEAGDFRKTQKLVVVR